jgi:hypothetical protein
MIVSAAESAARRPPSASPFDETARGMVVWGNDENEGWRKARGHFDKALQLDSRFMPALLQRGWTLDREYIVSNAPDPKVLAELGGNDGQSDRDRRFGRRGLDAARRRPVVSFSVGEKRSRRSSAQSPWRPTCRIMWPSGPTSMRTWGVNPRPKPAS